MKTSDWQVLDTNGQRKYLTEAERARFLAAARSLPRDRFALCALLAYSGCRISEALALGRGHVAPGCVTLRTLKRRRTVWRVVQVPVWLTDLLLALPPPACAANLPASACDLSPDRLWTTHRSTAWRHVKRVMRIAGVSDTAAMPKGLRHGFGIRAVIHQVPPNLIQRWLGHASPATTAHYLDAVGTEERRFAERLF